MAKIKITKTILTKQLHLKKGDHVIVDIDKAANVILLNDINLSLFKSGKAFTHQGGGGYFTTSRAILVCPSAGSWNVVIDLPNGGAIKHSIRVISE